MQGRVLQQHDRLAVADAAVVDHAQRLVEGHLHHLDVFAFVLEPAAFVLARPVGRGASAGVTSRRMSPGGPASQFGHVWRPIVVEVALVDVPAAPRTLHRIGRDRAPAAGTEDRDHGPILAGPADGRLRHGDCCP